VASTKFTFFLHKFPINL